VARGNAAPAHLIEAVRPGGRPPWFPRRTRDLGPQPLWFVMVACYRPPPTLPMGSDSTVKPIASPAYKRIR